VEKFENAATWKEKYSHEMWMQFCMDAKTGLGTEERAQI
jgi:hypothetical protein